ncbi:MAG: DEAD/DEAH box helicase [Candidatus Thorarchaeota archaeon]
MNVFQSLDKNITAFLTTCNITVPTPIQEKAIPLVLDEGDVLLLAPTGSGKTEAALVPLLHRLYQMKKERELFGFYLLYITPLRALNRDVFKRIEDLCDYLDLTVAVRHGDTTQYARRKQAITPPNLLITTPETLQAILPGKRLRYHLRTVFAVVVDEIHELADSKRGTQLSMGLERLEKLVGSDIQRVGLSATVGNPKDVAQLLVGTSQPVKTVWAGYGSQKKSLSVETPIPDKTHTALGKKISYPPHSTSRLQRIIDLVNAHTSTLVFTNTRSFAEVLGAKMRLINPGYEFDVHHGSLAKGTRLDAEDRLKQGVSKAIIATSSLELGIDIGQADLVIQYSSPREVSRALQRTGRSGHGVGKVSKGIILATLNLDDITESAVILRRARLNKVERAKIPRNAWDVLAHQITGLLLDLDEIEFNGLMKIVRSAFPFSDVTEEQMKWVLDFMVGKKIVEIDDDMVSRGRRSRVFYYEHLSTIPDVKKISAVDMTTRSSIGVLDEDYVASHVDVGAVFVIRGRPWQVVSKEEDEVLCAPTSDINTEAPRWLGEMIPVPYEVASEVGNLWKTLMTKSDKEVHNWLEKQYGLTGDAKNHVIQVLTDAKEVLGEIPSADSILIEHFDSGVVIHCPFGTKTNETLGIVIAALLTTRLGIQVGVERDPYRVLFTSDERIDPERILDILREYTGRQISTILRLALKQTQNFSSRFVHVARRMDVIRKDVKSKEVPVKRLIRWSEGTPVYEEALREVLDEKLDENRVISIFDDVSSGNICVNIVRTTAPSPLARLIVEEKTRFEVIGEITEENEVLAMMEERLLSRKFRLICFNGDWNSVRTVSTLEDEVKCPVCDSTMIAVLPAPELGFPKIVRKRVAGKLLTKEEEKEYYARSLTATLVSSYGKRALIVLAGRGIGPQTASRILRPGLTERLDILREIAKAEMEYARTRPYWG